MSVAIHIGTVAVRAAVNGEHGSEVKTMANRDTGENYGNTGGNPGNKGQENPRGQKPGQPEQPGQGGRQGDVRNQSEWEREQNKKKQNPNDPNQGGLPTDSDEEV